MAGAQHRRGEGLSTDEITTRAFPSAFRGVSEPEVRAYLRRVADELRSVRDREAALADRVRELEAELAHPTPPTEEQLLDALGEETARVLRSAQHAAEEIRRRAEERAGALLREAQEQAQAVRDEAAGRLESETARANEAAAGILRAAEEQAQARRDDGERVATEAIEHARAEGRRMLAEARDVRERVLGDLARRRDALTAQIEELRAGREQIVEAFRSVKRAYGEAVHALTRTDREVPAAAPTEGGVEIAATEAELEGVALAPEPEPEPEPVPEPVAAAEAGPEGVAAADAGPEGEPGERDVESIFARLRAQQARAAVGVAAAPTVAEVDLTAAEAEREPELAAPADEAAPAEPAAPAEVPEEAPAPLEGDARILATRDERVADLAHDLARAVKRRLQDEQNEVLDLIRRQKKKITVDGSLPDADAQRSEWASVVQAPVRDAFAAGAESVGGNDVKPDDELVVESARRMFEPLRDRVAATIAELVAPGADLDTSDLPANVGARYREWRNQDLDVAIDETLCAAYARGVYEAVPEGTVLRWIASSEGRCPDCDDNALEPTVRGEAFPTGQPFPPAHPGCRCLVAPADLEPAAAVGAAATNGA